jgi:NapH/MauN family ferredoxin-type protein
MAPIKIARRAFQVLFLGAVISLAAKLLLGTAKTTVEYYCPMGGVVSLYGLFRKQQFICTLSEMNLSLALALFVGVIATKKSFCSWVCPIGTISEGLAWVRGKAIKRQALRVPDGADRWLSKLKYVVLALVIILSYRTSELVFRGYDPFYILFTGTKGHGLIPVVSILVLVGVLALAFFFEMSWCRYLCPLGAAIDPLSKIGLLKIKRDGAKCNECGACDRVCPHRISVSKLRKVSRMDCTNCLECVSKCTPGALDMGV